MHLLCLSMGTKPFIFFEDISYRYNDKSRKRMDILDQSALLVLSRVAARIGLPIRESYETSFDVFSDIADFQGKSLEYSIWLKITKETPLGMFVSRSTLLGCNSILNCYFSAMSEVIGELLTYLDREHVDNLLSDQLIVDLVSNQLLFGVPIDYDLVI